MIIKPCLAALAALSLAGAALAQTSNVASRVPAPVRKAGVLRVGTSPTYPPLEYKDPMTQKLQGLDIDLVDEIGACGSRSSGTNCPSTS